MERFIASSRSQTFKLPESMMDYLTSSPAGYQKLLLTCKHFFASQQLVPVPKAITGPLITIEMFLQRIQPEYNEQLFVNGAINLEAYRPFLQNIIFRGKPKDLSNLAQNQYIQLPHVLYLINLSLRFDKFESLVENISTLFLSEVTIERPPDRTYLTLGDILVAVPQVSDLTFSYPNITPSFQQSNTMTIPYAPNLKKLTIFRTSVDPNEFVQFVTSHPGRTIRFITDNYIKFVEFQPVLKTAFPQAKLTQNTNYDYVSWCFQVDTTIVKLMYELPVMT